MAREPGAGLVPLAGLSAREAMAALTQRLDAAGIERAARDSRLLLLEALAMSGTDLMREPERRISEEEAVRLTDFAARRMAREPVSRILGERGFYGRGFHISPATLDPRPCTETVVDAVLEVAKAEGWQSKPIRILDVGTGSGALLVTLLAELPLATGVGTDIGDAALCVARENAERIGVASRATFLNRHILENVVGPFDIMVSNPPYIPTGDIAGLEPEVKSFDPRSALDGGADGLDFYRALAGGLDRCVPEGWALVEVGAGQADAVEALFRRVGDGPAGLETRTWADLGGHVRCVAVRTHC